MRSPAFSGFLVGIERGRTLRRCLADRRFRPLNRTDANVYAHASLAASVAAWDAFVKNVVRDFFRGIADPLSPQFHAIHSVSLLTAERLLEKFNTPNAENTRNLLVHATGYDPINDWIWSARAWPGLQVRERLNEILKVRHSFAHGFPMPSLAWTQSPRGPRLTVGALKEAEAFFINLVKRTDLGAERHMQVTYGRVAW